MYSTGAAIMDEVNADFQSYPDDGEKVMVPFTLMIAQHAIPEESDRYDPRDSHILADYSLMKSGDMKSSFPEEWLDFSQRSTGEPVLNGPNEVDLYEAEVLDAISEFVSEPDEPEDVEGKVFISAESISLWPVDTTKFPAYGAFEKKFITAGIDIPQEHYAGEHARPLEEIVKAKVDAQVEEILLDDPIEISDERRANLLKLAQADGQPWTDDQSESGWTDHMAEVMYGEDLDIAIANEIESHPAVIVSEDETKPMPALPPSPPDSVQE